MTPDAKLPVQLSSDFTDPLKVSTFQGDDGQDVEVTLANGRAYTGNIDDVSKEGVATLLCKTSKKWVRFQVASVVSIAWDSGY